jgi:hypothetical protein
VTSDAKLAAPALYLIRRVIKKAAPESYSSICLAAARLCGKAQGSGRREPVFGQSPETGRSNSKDETADAAPPCRKQKRSPVALLFIGA